MTIVKSTSHAGPHQLRQRNRDRMLRYYCSQVDLRLQKLRQDDDEPIYLLHSYVGQLGVQPMSASEVMDEVRARR